MMHPCHIKPPVPGVYQVSVMAVDWVTREPLGMVDRWAKWTGQWWCAWAVDEQRAAMCSLPFGPIQGYPWFDAWRNI